MANRYDAVLFGGSGVVARGFLKKMISMRKRILVLGRAAPDISSKFVEWRPLDLRRAAVPFADKIESAAAVFLAGQRGHFAESSDAFAEQGRVSAPDLVELFGSLGLRAERLITVGSSAEYGPREDGAPVDEDDALHPLSSYAFWKVRLAERGRAWMAASGGEHIHLRPFVIYDFDGRSEDMFLEGLVNRLSDGGTFAMTGGEAWRSFCHVGTLVDVLDRLLNLPSWPERVLNVSDEDYWQVRVLACRTRDILRSGNLALGAIPYQPYEVWHQRPSLERLGKLTELLPRGRLLEAIESRRVAHA
jgi:nucleoside-diphosphate-sugar epimerase